MIARTKLVFSSSVVKPASAGSIDESAQPIAVSTSVATIPPCIVPIGFSCTSSANMLNTVRPGCDLVELHAEQRGRGRRGQLAALDRDETLVAAERTPGSATAPDPST